MLLAASSQDSYRRPAAAGGTALAARRRAKPDAEDRGGAGAGGRGRRVCGPARPRISISVWWSPAPANSPATNIFPTSRMASFRSRCCAGSRPTRRCRGPPQTYQLAGNRPHQPADARRFIALEVLLPLSTLLLRRLGVVEAAVTKAAARRDALGGGRRLRPLFWSCFSARSSPPGDGRSCAARRLSRPRVSSQSCRARSPCRSSIEFGPRHASPQSRRMVDRRKAGRRAGRACVASRYWRLRLMNVSEPMREIPAKN